jgi:hypothetical protein
MLLTPSLVVLVSYIQKRWGHSWGGRVIGLPLSTGPFLILIYLSGGAAETAHAAHGVVAGQIAVVAYCFSFAFLGWRTKWFAALPIAWLVAISSDLIMIQFSNTWLVGAAVALTSAVAVKFWPRALTNEHTERQPAWWETPMRAALAGSLVATLTGIKHIIGVQAAGVAASMPIILSVLAPTTLRTYGPSATSDLLRGTTKSLGGSVMFSTVVAATITNLPAFFAFMLGLVGLIITDAALSWSRRNSNRLETIDF